MKKYVCPVCGYVHEGDTPPESCPVCRFREIDLPCGRRNEACR